MQEIKLAGRPQTSEKEVESVPAAHTRSPRKFSQRASTLFHIPRSTIYKVLLKNKSFIKFCLKFFRVYAYEVLLLHALKPEDKRRRNKYAVSMLECLDLDPDVS